MYCSGWLNKRGGRGHGIKNLKKRWVVLQGTFLCYYKEKPETIKDISLLKGCLFLLGSKISSKNEKEFSLLTNSGKEYIFSPCRNTLLELNYWQDVINFAIQRAKKYRRITEIGWLKKIKIKFSDNNYKPKKRLFVIQGTHILYYSKQSHVEDDIAYLKGRIDIRSITRLTKKTSLQNSSRFCIVIGGAPAPRYHIETKDEQITDRWVSLITRIYTSIVLENCSSVKSKIKKSGKMEKLCNEKRKQVWCKLTTRAVIITKHERQIGIYGIIPLLGCHVQLCAVHFAGINFVDVHGVSHSLIASSHEEALDWVTSIEKSRESLIRQIISKGERICLDTNNSYWGHVGESLPVYFIGNSCIEVHTYNNPNSKFVEQIPYKSISSINLRTVDYCTIFYLEYTNAQKQPEKIKQVQNSIGLFKTISIALKHLGHENLCVDGTDTNVDAKMKQKPKSKSKNKKFETKNLVKIRSSNDVILRPISLGFHKINSANALDSFGKSEDSVAKNEGFRDSNGLEMFSETVEFLQQITAESEQLLKAFETGSL